MIVMLILYIIIGALLGSVYYYLQLRRDRYDTDLFYPIWVGAIWPIFAPFAFAFYLARELSNRNQK